MKKFKTIEKFIQSTLCMGLIFATSLGHSGVVVNGTRIIFEGGQQEKTVQLNNKDRHPNLVQIWSDRGQAESTLENADGPFIANPQIFKMNSQQGQVVRLKFIGQASELPQDQESLFYLNINEIPALKSQDIEANRLVVSFTNRLKILYRPKTIKGHPTDVPEKITYHLKNGQIQLTNPTAYHAHIAEIKMIQNGRVIQQDKSLIIAPKSQINWSVKSMSQTTDTEVTAVFINDYGGRTTSTLQSD